MGFHQYYINVSAAQHQVREHFERFHYKVDPRMEPDLTPSGHKLEC